MTKNSITLRIAALKPRNPFARLARRRAAGAHLPDQHARTEQQKDLLQRLREAGL